MFDRVIVADWSANAAPKLGADSIWLAIHESAGATVTHNVSTRCEAEAMLSDLFADPAGPSTLLGVDFSLGYPSGTRRTWGHHHEPAWSATWDLLASRMTDGPRNANNRFEVAADLNSLTNHDTDGVTAGPFWGCPPTRASRSLTSTKPTRCRTWPSQWRSVESMMREQGHRPFDCWQLLGAGSVGSQSLMGIPMLERLRRRYADRVEVWPFTTGLQAPLVGRASIVVAEVWPSLHAVDVEGHAVRDEAQVVATAHRLAVADGRGELDSMFTPMVDGCHVDAVVNEEGWVLGVDPGPSDERS